MKEDTEEAIRETIVMMDRKRGEAMAVGAAEMKVSRGATPMATIKTTIEEMTMTEEGGNTTKTTTITMMVRTRTMIDSSDDGDDNANEDDADDDEDKDDKDSA